MIPGLSYGITNEFLVEDKIWTLLARQLAGEASPEESEELQQLLARDPGMAKIAQEIKEGWDKASTYETHKALSSFSKIDLQIQNKAGKSIKKPDVPVIAVHSGIRKFRVAIAVAASIIILAGLWFIFKTSPETNTTDRPIVALHEIFTLPKSIREASLPDGSVIHLNEGSKIAYSDAFNTHIREVWLTGEAFFDVAKNKDKPFIIHAGKVNIKVTGTSFNVRSYQDEQQVETSLIHGSIEVTTDDEPGKKYMLVPNQKLTIPLSGKNASDQTAALPVPVTKEIRYSILKPVTNIHSADSLIAELSWMEGKLAFNEIPFNELAIRLGKRFNVEFVFEDSSKENLSFTGVFYKQDLRQVLERLAIAESFRYRIKDSIVYIQK